MAQFLKTIRVAQDENECNVHLQRDGGHSFIVGVLEEGTFQLSGTRPVFSFYADPSSLDLALKTLIGADVGLRIENNFDVICQYHILKVWEISILPHLGDTPSSVLVQVKCVAKEQ